MSATTDAAGRADAWNDRANDFFGFILRGKADRGDHAEYQRSAARLQDALVAVPLPSRDDEWPIEDTDAILGPLRIDLAALEAWEHSRATDFDVTDDVPF